MNDLFIFTPGFWIGEGMMELSNVEEKIPFIIKWMIPTFKPEDPYLELLQQIQIKGHTDSLNNNFVLKDFQKHHFSIILENDNIGQIAGHGQIKNNWIGWEFKQNLLGFDGFEYYQHQGDGHYIMEAEYSTSDDLRTVMRGKLWKHTKAVIQGN
jgi:hypothetical protein